MPATASWRPTRKNTELVSFRCSAEVRERLEAVAVGDQSRPSIWVRQLVEKALNELEQAA